MAIANEEPQTATGSQKQWDIKTITIPAVRQSFWGIEPVIIRQFVQLYGKEAINDLKGGEEYLNLSFAQLKNVVAFLYRKGFDTSNLSEAVQKAIDALVLGNEQQKSFMVLKDFKQMVEKRYADNPIIVRDDLQKDRWGGQSNNNGFQLNATVTKALIPGFFSFEVTVHSADLIRNEQLTGHVAFFLHDTFPNEIEYVVAENGIATLKLALCYEAFTIAAYTENGTELELDLNEVPGYPKGFYWRDHSAFQDRITELYNRKPVTIKDDLQKDRWGGKNSTNGKTLSATVDSSWVPKFFNVRLKVSFSESTSVNGEVAFFLHDTFKRQIRFAPIKNGIAELKIKAYEAFTVGAYTEDGTELELDLQTQQGYPQDFYYSEKERGSDGLLPFNDKWVLVAGTGSKTLSYEEKVMSEMLGRSLAREGFGLICGGWFGVDKVVSESFADFFRTKQIPYEGRLIQLVEADQNPSYEVGVSRVLDKDEDWYQEALKQAHALIMIGGKGGTYLAYERASNTGIPVLPIPQTGGDALRAFNELVESSRSSISPNQLKELNQPIKSIDDAEIISGSILKILNQLTKENRTISPTDFKATVKELYRSRPIVIEKDPQKNRWGGTPVRNGKRLMASVKKSSKWYYDITIDLITEAGSSLHGDVAFFLHSSFKDPIRFTRASKSRAQIRVRASNAFVIGAYTEDGTMLELDLQMVEGYPKDFYYNETQPGEFQFYTEVDICGLVGSRIASAKEFVTGYLLIFQTRKQKTWLVATSKSIFVLLDDAKTRGKDLIMTSFQKKGALPLSFRNSQKFENSLVVKFAAQDTWWYYTKELFPKTEMLTEGVRNLIETSLAEPLTSLEFQLTVESADSTLKSNISQGQEDERENEESTQAGVPRIPYEVENFRSLLTPIVEYLGNLSDDFTTRSGSEISYGFVVLLALDDIRNCILSFGDIGGIDWSSKSNKQNLSAGFVTNNFFSRSSKLSCPYANGIISNKGLNSYSITWNLDPITFKNSIDQKNKNLSPTTTLPEILQMIVLSSIEQLPFLENDFSQTSAVNLWTSTNSKNILKKSSQFNATVSLSVNREVGSGYVYKLSEVFFEELYDEFGKPYELKCTKFLFDKQ